MRGSFDTEGLANGKPRSFPYSTPRQGVARNGVKTTKAAMVCLERTADELKKSRMFWWRVMAVLAGLLLLHMGGLSFNKWQQGHELGTMKSVMGEKGMKSGMVPSMETRMNVTARDVAKAVEQERAGETGSQSRESGGSKAETGEIADTAGGEPVGDSREGRKEDAKLKAWENREIPEFCKKIFEKPIPFDKACHRSGKNMTCTNLEGTTMMFSQFHQDYYLFTQHFKHLKRPGVYMDVASNDAIGISNSYFFDACLGWRGVCVEGNPEYYERIYRLRTCSLVPTCVARRDGTSVEFGLAGGAGGVLGESHKHMQVWAERRKEVHTIKERCTTLERIMSKEGFVEVDYLSLDVEGLELDVLKGMDWEKTKINVLTVEVSRDTIKGIEAYLTELGYKKHIPTLNEQSERTGLLRDDAVFLHEDVVFGEPK